MNMDVTILIPHYKTGKLTAHAVYEILKHSEGHNVDIIIIDNAPGPDSGIEYLQPFADHITILPYTKNMIQSHGVAYDYAMPFVHTERFITMESDSYPARDRWLNYYENIKIGGSVLKLSGGTFLHPAGAIYTKELWHNAMNYIKTVPYMYFPNMEAYNGFDYHLMVHGRMLETFLNEPTSFIQLGKGYIGLDRDALIEKANYYSPIMGVFHNGIGEDDEFLNTYGSRTKEKAMPTGNRLFIRRIGAEPGQWLYWLMCEMGINFTEIFTDVMWMPGFENRQQQQTLNAAGVIHEWGMTAYREDKSEIGSFKQRRADELYRTVDQMFRIE